MFAVIFEVRPRPDRWDDYLALAKQLRSRLEATDGFIDNERFKSRHDDRRVLSLSTWRDEKAVVRWRTHGEHHGVQEKGRFEIFEDYHLRVGEIISDTHPPAGLTVGQTRQDETEIGVAKVATITEITPAPDARLVTGPDGVPAGLGLDAGAAGLVATEMFESITTPGKLAVLSSWTTAEAAAAWTPGEPDGAAALRHRRVRILRDYGMFARHEAPQYYPAVARPEEPSRRSPPIAARTVSAS